VFDSKDAPGIWIEDLPDYGAVIRLPEVHIRIDPFAAVGNEHRTSLRPGMIIVAANEVIVTVPIQMRNWTAVNLSTGRYVVDRLPASSVSFAALSLVIGDGDDEREIGRFAARSSAA
jgi:hypothetical protein